MARTISTPVYVEYRSSENANKALAWFFLGFILHWFWIAAYCRGVTALREIAYYDNEIDGIGKARFVVITTGIVWGVISTYLIGCIVLGVIGAIVGAW